MRIIVSFVLNQQILTPLVSSFIISYRNRLVEAHRNWLGFDHFRINGTDEVNKLPMKYRTYENNTKENQ